MSDASPVDGLIGWISPERTDVLAIDMQVDFASPHGALGEVVDLSTIPAALRAAERLVRSACKSVVAVVFIGHRTDQRTESPAWRERMRRLGGDAEADSGLCRAGTVAAQFVGPTPSNEDVVVFKSRYSGCHGTDLHGVLQGPSGGHADRLRSDHSVLRRLHGSSRLSPGLSCLCRYRPFFNMHRIPAVTTGFPLWRPTPQNLVDSPLIYALTSLAICGRRAHDPASARAHPIYGDNAVAAD